MIKCVYDEKVEVLINNIFNELSDADEAVFALEALYDETKYPGALYWCGIIIQDFSVEIKDDELCSDIKYFLKAALGGYANAMIELIYYYLEKGKKELHKAKYWADKLVELSKSNQALYYVAIVNLFELLYYDLLITLDCSYNTKLYNETIEIMKQLSDQKDERAIYFLDRITGKTFKEKNDKHKDYLKDYCDEYEKELYDKVRIK